MQDEHVPFNSQQVESGTVREPAVPVTDGPDSSPVKTNKNILDKLRERDKPLLASGEPAHGPG